jgi:hypothetical protein
MTNPDLPDEPYTGRYFERQSRELPNGKIKQETSRAWRAFQIFRDLGANRTYAEVARKLGFTTDGQVRVWAKEWDWPGRIRALEDYHSSIEQEAVDRYIRERAEDHAKLGEDVKEHVLRNRQKAARLTEKALNELERMPFVRQNATRSETFRTASGEELEVDIEYTFEPAVGSLDLAAQRLHRIASGEKLDQTGIEGAGDDYGQDPNDIEREFEEWVSELVNGEEEFGV